MKFTFILKKQQDCHSLARAFKLRKLTLENSTQLAGFISTTPKIRPPSLSEISFSDGPSKEPEEGNFKTEPPANGMT